MEHVCRKTSAGMGSVWRRPCHDVILEIGAHSTLAGPVRQILDSRDVELPYISCLKRPVDAVEATQDLVCQLLVSGFPVALESVNFPHSSQHASFVTDLPMYSWNHATHFWVKPKVSKDQRFKKFPPHELLSSYVNGSNSSLSTWRNILRLGEME